MLELHAGHLQELVEVEEVSATMLVGFLSACREAIS